jgi:hypothetical protein
MIPTRDPEIPGWNEEFETLGNMFEGLEEEEEREEKREIKIISLKYMNICIRNNIL